MEEAKIKRSQLEAIAVSKGPGSYTGLRIGVSAAKGLCYALDKPLISISTLEALAHQARTDDGLIIPMLDARRMEVYSAVFDQRYRQVREIEAEIITPSSFEAYLSNGKVCFIGNGVEKSMDIITHPNAVFIKDKLPSSNDMGLLSFKKYLGKQFEDVAYFEPFYLKDFISLGART
jgi:tRNA threonylcarbamoyladenosine biosynthesis protein TsaB